MLHDSGKYSCLRNNPKSFWLKFYASPGLFRCISRPFHNLTSLIVYWAWTDFDKDEASFSGFGSMVVWVRFGVKGCRKEGRVNDVLVTVKRSEEK